MHDQVHRTTAANPSWCHEFSCGVLRQKKPILPFHISIHALAKTKLVKTSHKSNESNRVQSITTKKKVEQGLQSYSKIVPYAYIYIYIYIYIYTYIYIIYICHLTCLYSVFTMCLLISIRFRTACAWELKYPSNIKNQRPRRNIPASSDCKIILYHSLNRKIAWKQGGIIAHDLKVHGNSKHRMKVPQPPLCLWNCSKDSNLTANGCPVRMLC